ncbi:MAG: TonB-dependent receptor plug domain-containing protein, partial [Gemmatimonadales bacterium]
LSAFHTIDILRNIPGIVVKPQSSDPNAAKVRFARCSGPSANVEVYIDGIRQMQRDSVAPVGFESDSNAYGNRVSVSLSRIAAPEIKMMEVFRGVGQIPGELNENACAVVMIWTRWNPRRGAAGESQVWLRIQVYIAEDHRTVPPAITQ